MIDGLLQHMASIPYVISCPVCKDCHQTRKEMVECVTRMCAKALRDRDIRPRCESDFFPS